MLVLAGRRAAGRLLPFTMLVFPLPPLPTCRGAALMLRHSMEPTPSEATIFFTIDNTVPGFLLTGLATPTRRRELLGSIHGRPSCD